MPPQGLEPRIRSRIQFSVRKLVGLTQLTIRGQGVHTACDERAQSFRCGLHPVLDRGPAGLHLHRSRPLCRSCFAQCLYEVMPKAYTRLLTRLPPDTAALWQEVEPLIDKRRGLLVVDDTTLDKPYAQGQALRPENEPGDAPLERQASCGRRRD